VTSGVLVAFEGIDASGKSTQARRVAAAHNAVLTFEPGDTPLGAELRRWLLDKSEPMSPSTEALLMLADRAHHVHHLIAPTLAAGRSVVTDRYLASTLAYQGYGRGVDLDALHSATALAVGDCRPHLTVLLDVPVEVADARRAPAAGDRFESADGGFRERVRDGFLALAASSSDPWVVIDGTADLDAVDAAVDAALAPLAWPQ